MPHLEQPAYVATTQLCGRTFYVGNSTTLQDGAVAGSNSNSGLSQYEPWATLAYAVTRCTAGRGDTIVLLPGHAENISSAGFITIGTAGITIKGVGNGDLRPTFTWTATTGTILHTVTTGANTTWENIYFDFSGIDAVTVGITCAAADVTFRNCRFRTSRTSQVALLGMSLASTANRFMLDRCKVWAGVSTANTTNFITVVGAVDEFVMQDCDIEGYFTTSVGVLQNTTTAMTNLRIVRNILSNRTASSTVLLDFGSLAVSGIIAYNSMHLTLNSDVNGIAASGSPTYHLTENYITNDVAETGLVMGTVSG